MIPLSRLQKIIDDARYAEDIESDLYELVNEMKQKKVPLKLPKIPWKHENGRWVRIKK